MAKPNKKEEKTEREFNVLIGFNVDPDRWEIGASVKESELSADVIEDLLAQKAIEVK